MVVNDLGWAWIDFRAVRRTKAPLSQLSRVSESGATTLIPRDTDLVTYGSLFQLIAPGMDTSSNVAIEKRADLNKTELGVTNHWVGLTSMFFDEDGDLAHEFFVEVPPTRRGCKATMKKVLDNLTPQSKSPQKLPLPAGSNTSGYQSPHVYPVSRCLDLPTVVFSLGIPRSFDWLGTRALAKVEN
uniref:Uncharacterized protein n=1 Tax=Timema cristinae TaxID=61476 RepID=A0A7R9D4Z1_TIMCR|nr:unnamed protein product [Timema cristinae]